MKTLDSTSIGASRREFIAGSAAGIAAISLPGMALAQEQPVRGGILRVAQAAEPPMLVSAFNTSTFIGLISSKILEGLVEYDFQMNPKPLLAESWTVSPDGKTYTFKLRGGVKWHDGQPFSSADVQFSAMEVWKKRHPRSLVTWANLQSVDTPDAATAVFNFAKPIPFLLSFLGRWESQIVAKHIYADKDVLTNPANNAPIGTGPYVFKEWKKGDFVRVERNPTYWQAGQPYLDQIIFRFITDAGSRAAAFETQEVHLGCFTPVSLSDMKRLAALPHIGVETRGYEMFGAVYLMEVNHRHEQLKDKRVRQAIMHALDRKFIIDTIWFGYGKVATGPVTSASPFYTTAGVPQYAYDVAKANKLLDDAGYKRGANNMRFKLTTEYPTIQAEIARTAEYMKQALGRIGIDLELRASDLATAIRRYYTDYDFNVTQNWLYSLPDPSAGVQRLYYGPNIRKGVAFANASGYSRPDLDKLWDEALVETDVAKRKVLMHKAQQIVQEDLPNLTIAEMQFLTVFNKRLRNHTTGADGAYSSLRDAYLVP
jgi:peptide/nickel transport system substrate-binding protein